MKEGDIVRCIANVNENLNHPEYCKHRLTVGKLYKVLNVCDTHIDVINDFDVLYSYHKERFELVCKNEEVSGMSREFVEGGKAICTLSSALDDELSLYKVYDVLEVHDNSIVLENDKGLLNPYVKTRFNPMNPIKPSVPQSEIVESTNKEAHPVLLAEVIDADNSELTKGEIVVLVDGDEDWYSIRRNWLGEVITGSYPKYRFKVLPLDEVKVAFSSLPNEWHGIESISYAHDASALNLSVVINTLSGYVLYLCDAQLSKVEQGSTEISANGLAIKNYEGETVFAIDVDGRIGPEPMLSLTNQDMASSECVANAINANELIIQLPSTINILGTDYSIDITNPDKDEYLEGNHGYCDFLTKSIVLRKVNPLDYSGNIDAVNAQYKTNLRHEIMHAFLYESGLDGASVDGWARNEEMIDYMALQLPKIIKACNTCGILD